MDMHLKIYLSGVAVSAILCLALTLAKDEIRISDIISIFLNVICSWATPISLMGMAIFGFLNKKHWNKLIYSGKKQDKNQIIKKMK